MTTTTNVEQVKINVMTNSQYTSATKNANELYMVTDASISYNDLSNKPDLSVYQTTANLVTSVSSSSTDSQYPSAKLFYDTIGDIETLLAAI